MTDPVTLATLGGVALTEGIKFLYGQAGEILRRWRELAASEDVGEPVAPPDADVLAGELAPVVPDWQLVGRLERDVRALRKELSEVGTGADDADPSDSDLIASAEALRRSLEVILRQEITFVGEQREAGGPVTDGSVTVDEALGYVAGARVRGLSTGSTKGRARARIAHPGSEVIGVDVTADP